MLQWIKDVMHDEYEAFIGLFVVAGVLFVGAFFGWIFGGIGDFLFGKKKKESNDSPS